jgi:hypothetical protein
MCDCSDYELPDVFEEVVRRARKRHRCAECKGLIMPRNYYWESRGLWDGQWGTFRTCGSCYVLAHTILDCYTFRGLADCIDEEYDLSDRTFSRDARVARAGMRRRRRLAERTLRLEISPNA